MGNLPAAGTKRRTNVFIVINTSELPHLKAAKMLFDENIVKISWLLDSNLSVCMNANIVSRHVCNARYLQFLLLYITNNKNISKNRGEEEKV